MKRSILLFLPLILLLITAPLRAQNLVPESCAPKTDEQYRKLMVGKWTDTVMINGLEYEGDQTFDENGKLTVIIYNQNDPTDTDTLLEADATWKIENGILYEKAISVTPQIMDPEDAKTKDKILCLDNKALKLYSLDEEKVLIRHRQ